MRYAIGVPGGTVRMYIEVLDPAFAQAQLQAGEVLVEVEWTQRGMATISDDGTTVVPADA